MSPDNVKIDYVDALLVIGNAAGAAACADGAGG
jgi:hypothetical protein